MKTIKTKQQPTTNISNPQSFETLINNLVDGVIEIDKNGVVQMYNASALRILDTNATLTGQCIDQVMPVTNTKGKKLNIFDMIKGINHVDTFDEILYRLQTNEEIQLEITVSPIKDALNYKDHSEAFGYLLILRDVTQIKDLEAERDEFISIVSHELRTPITVVEGALSNLDLVISKKADHNTIKKFADIAHNQIMLLANMTNDLASLSRAERARNIEIEEINLQSLVSDLYQKYSSIASQKDLNFDIDTKFGSKTINTNRLYLEEILQNLIVNAIKYTNSGSITLGVLASNKETEFYVKDTGIGISRIDQVDVFRKFFRVEDYQTRKTNGTGLGLFLAQRLASKLDSEIQLKSRLNFGSTFSFIVKNQPKP